MRNERVRGDLAVEFGGPAAGDLCGAAWAAAFGSEAVVFDQVSVAADQSFIAMRAARVFAIADPAGQISGIDVAQAGFAADFGGAQQVFRRGVALAFALHFVVAVKCGDVPGDVGRDAGDEFGEAGAVRRRSR